MLLRVDVTKEFVTCGTVFQFSTGDEMIFVHRSPRRFKIDGEEEEEEEQKFATNASERASERGVQERGTCSRATKFTPYDSWASWLLRIRLQFDL
jgi:hypothetical protein